MKIFLFKRHQNGGQDRDTSCKCKCEANYSILWSYCVPIGPRATKSSKQLTMTNHASRGTF
jgi:hypothetical protein